MTKLIFKIFLMMCTAMLLVIGISRVALFVLEQKNITDPTVSLSQNLIQIIILIQMTSFPSTSK